MEFNPSLWKWMAIIRAIMVVLEAFYGLLVPEGKNWEELKRSCTGTGIKKKEQRKMWKCPYFGLFTGRVLQKAPPLLLWLDREKSLLLSFSLRPVFGSVASVLVNIDKRKKKRRRRKALTVHNAHYAPPRLSGNHLRASSSWPDPGEFIGRREIKRNRTREGANWHGFSSGNRWQVRGFPSKREERRNEPPEDTCEGLGYRPTIWEDYGHGTYGPRDLESTQRPYTRFFSPFFSKRP